MHTLSQLPHCAATTLTTILLRSLPQFGVNAWEGTSPATVPHTGMGNTQTMNAHPMPVLTPMFGNGRMPNLGN